MALVDYLREQPLPYTSRREAHIEEGLPPGWKAIEKTYVSGKYAGSAYTRYYSLDGRHKHIGSARQVIRLHAEDHGQDPEEALKLYEQRLKEKHERLAAQRALEAEERGRVKGEKREACIRLFNERYGPLRGSLVHAFAGWRTRWDYMPNCGQIHVTYTDPEGNEWKLLKDLEAYFGKRMQEGEDIGAKLEKAKALENPDMFREGSQAAKRPSNYGTFESSAADVHGFAVLDPKGALAMQRPAHMSFVPAPLDDRYEDGPVVVARCVPQEDGNAEASRIQELLVRRGFDESVQLLYVSCLEQGHAVAEALSGLYYRMPHDCNGRPCYRQVQECPHRPGRLRAPRLYLSWAGDILRRWRIGSLEEQFNGYANVQDDSLDPANITNQWRVVKMPAPMKGKERSRSRTPPPLQHRAGPM